MKNVKLTLAYDGGAYLGWQKADLGPSIEEALQKALEKILQEQIVLQAAGRTDAGVHAMGQTANFFTQKKDLDLNKLLIGVNRLLPKDIVLLSVESVDSGFHPTLDCIGKEYRYYLCNSAIQLPQHRHFSWHVPYSLDLAKMNMAAKELLGKKNFKTLCNAKNCKSYKNHEREITEITIENLPDSRFCIRISGNHFLYKMARNIAGLLICVGREKIKVDEIKRILESQDRTLAGITAPAHGLTLFQVHYPTPSQQQIQE